MAGQYLFTNDLLSDKIQQTLPPGFYFRSLERGDFDRGHLDVLADLAWMGSISESDWTGRFDLMSRLPGTYYVLVIVDKLSERIIGTGTLLIEKKFLCQLGTQGHIEDIAIKKEHQGKKFGVKLLAALDHIAEEVGAYKTILDCSPENEGFYIKCGYDKAGSEMHQYYDEEAEKNGV